MKKTLKKIVKWEKLILVLLMIIVLGSVFLIRYTSNQPLLYEQESFYHLNQVKDYVGGEIKFIDLNPLEWLVLGISKIISLSRLDNFLFILSPVLGLLSILFYTSTRKRLNLNQNKNFIFLLILILSPAFIFTFTTLSNYAMISFLALLGFFLLSLKKKWKNYLALPVFLLIPFFETLSSVIILTVLISLYIFSSRSEKDSEKKGKKPDPENSLWEELKGKSNILRINVVAILIATILSNVLLEKLWVSVSEISFANNFWQNLVADFGGLAGISIFVIVLAIIGLYSILKEKTSYFVYLSLIILLVSFYLNNMTIYLLSIVFAYLAASFTYDVIGKKWALIEIKNFTILLLALGVIFSGLTYIDRISDYSPQQDLIDSLTWLDDYEKDYSEVSFTLLSLPENGFYISYRSNFESFTTLNEQNIDPVLRGKIDDFLEPDEVIPGKEVFYLTYPLQLFPVLENSNVKYVLIDPQTKELFEEKGLLFTLRNERFKLIYSDEDFEVWEFDLEGEEE